MVFLMKWLIKSNLTFLFEIPTLNLPNKINFTVYVTLTFCPPSEISIQYRYILNLYFETTFPKNSETTKNR